MNTLMIFGSITIAVGMLSAPSVTAQEVTAQEQSPISATHLFTAKFLCGGSSEAFQEGVVRGVHATSITLHNPSNVRAVSFTKSVSRALPFQRPGDIAGPVVDTLQPGTSIDVECNEIRMMLPISMTRQFRSGFLQIEATGDLSVAAVYSSRPRDGDVSTIDVEVIEARKLGRDEGELPDLVIQDIDLDTLRVSCPTGAGSCEASVTVIVENQGSAASAGFDVRTTFDPAQGIDVENSVADGLEPGQSSPLDVNVKTGGNCFDPDCQICATADSNEAIEESDEGNNTLCRQRQG